ncbi:MAG TPA: tRNA pseudouridine(38-40) synthase TruA [Lacipirellula sp.]
MPRFKITLAYDGAEFSGWQAQPGQRTVQGELERAWFEITGESVRLNAAGRTDAGVHAAGQAASVESATQIAPEALVGALNAKLPDDAAVLSVERANDDFHATHDAKRKRYRYTIYNYRRRPVFMRRCAWHIPTPLDIEAMQQGAKSLIGTHDFISFQSAGSERESTVRTIFAVDVAQSGAGEGAACSPLAPTKPAAAGPPRPGGLGRGCFDDERDAVITIDVEGDGFLYNMVRAIAGTLAEVGRGRRTPESIADVVAACDRCAAGQTAPAHGLTLLWVDY